jgi:N-methylhydantoinase A
VPAMPGALSALGILMSDFVRDYSRTVMLKITNKHMFEPVSSKNSAERRRAQGSTAFNRRDRRVLAEKTENNLKSEVQAALDSHFVELESKGAAEFQNEGLAGLATRSADLRYVGQGYELNVLYGPQMLAEFHAAHRKRYGHADEGRAVEVVNVRIRMIATAEELKLPRKATGDSSSDHAIIKRNKVMFHGEWLETQIMARDLLSPGNRFHGPAIVHEYSATTVVPPVASAHVDEHFNIVIEV